MKRIISGIVCAAMLAGLAAVGVSAEDDTLLIAPAPTADEAVEAVEAEVGIEEDITVLPVIEPEILPFEVDETVNALVLGDSNACGYGLETFNPLATAPVAGSFAEIAFSKVLAEGETAAMFAVPGATTDDVLDLFTNEAKVALTTAAVAQADYIIINVGGNDLIEAVTAALATTPMPLSAEAVEVTDAAELLVPDLTGVAEGLKTALTAAVEELGVKYATLMATILAINPDAYIAINTIPEVDVAALLAANGVDASIVALVDAFAAEILGAANAAMYATIIEEPRVYAFIFDNLVEYLPEGSTVFQLDGIHFSAAAHQFMGDFISGTFLDVIETERQIAEAAAAKERTMIALIGLLGR